MRAPKLHIYANFQVLKPSSLFNQLKTTDVTHRQTDRQTHTHTQTISFYIYTRCPRLLRCTSLFKRKIMQTYIDYKPHTPHHTYNTTYMHAFASGICDIPYKSQIFMLFHDISRNIDFPKNPKKNPQNLVQNYICVPIFRS